MGAFVVGVLIAERLFGHEGVRPSVGGLLGDAWETEMFAARSHLAWVTDVRLARFAKRLLLGSDRPPRQAPTSITGSRLSRTTSA